MEDEDDGLSESADLDSFEDDEEYDEQWIDEYEDESELWEESPLRIPIVEMNEIRSFVGMDNFNIFQDRSFRMQGNTHAGQKDPYWTNCNREPICILCKSEGFGSQYMNFNDNAGRYFQKNRHVYIDEFDSGIVVITHWKMNNYLRPDRYRPTLHQSEKAMLESNESWYNLPTVGIPVADKREPEGNGNYPVFSGSMDIIAAEGSSIVVQTVTLM